WETATGKVVTRFEGTTGTIAYSPDGRLLAQSRGKKAVLRDMRPGKAAERFLGHDAALRAVAFSPDGKVLAAADEDGAISLWDVAVERRLRKLLGHAVCVKRLAFSPDGKHLASGSGDPLQGQRGELHTLRLWDVATGAELAKLGSHAEGVAGV